MRKDGMKMDPHFITSIRPCVSSHTQSVQGTRRRECSCFTCNNPTNGISCPLLPRLDPGCQSCPKPDATATGTELGKHEVTGRWAMVGRGGVVDFVTSLCLHVSSGFPLGNQHTVGSRFSAVASPQLHRAGTRPHTRPPCIRGGFSGEGKQGSETAPGPTSTFQLPTPCDDRQMHECFGLTGVGGCGVCDELNPAGPGFWESWFSAE